MSVTSPSSELRALCGQESARIQQEFASDGDGRALIAKRTSLIESIVTALWQQISQDGNAAGKTSLVALGGFGRGWLFPYSDIDLLFLHENRESEEAFKEPVRRFSQALWDLRLKLSPTTRTLAECDRLDPSNVEFALALLDCRFLGGDQPTFSRLRDKVLPHLIVRESQTLVERLANLTRERHAKHGETVFHLEPNIKDAPGGLRDYNLVCWLALISAMEKLRDWPEPKSLLPVSARRQLEPALEFLISLRCFLHYRQHTRLGRSGRSRGTKDRDLGGR
jgi:[protein-PII] uridylyltransferase